MKGGECGFVLPRYSNIKYIDIEQGKYFGIIDILGSLLANDTTDFAAGFQQKDLLKRQFTVQCQKSCDLLNLSLDNLQKMEKEFPDSYDDLFASSYNQLNRAHKIKLHAIKFCNQNKSKLLLDQDTDYSEKTPKHALNQRQIMSKKTITIDKDMNFRAIPLQQVDEESSMFDESSQSSSDPDSEKGSQNTDSERISE